MLLPNHLITTSRKRVHIRRQMGTIAPLDGLPLPVRANAFQRLISDYTGPCCKLRRAADDEELDIGFGSNGIVDDNAVQAWAPEQQVLITTLYGQVGGFNLTQTNPALQPEYRADAMYGRPGLHATVDGTPEAHSGYLVGSDLSLSFIDMLAVVSNYLVAWGRASWGLNRFTNNTHAIGMSSDKPSAMFETSANLITITGDVGVSITQNAIVQYSNDENVGGSLWANGTLSEAFTNLDTWTDATATQYGTGLFMGDTRLHNELSPNSISHGVIWNILLTDDQRTEIYKRLTDFWL